MSKRRTGVTESNTDPLVIRPCRGFKHGQNATGSVLVVGIWALSNAEQVELMTGPAAISTSQIAILLEQGRVPHASQDAELVARALNLIRGTVPAQEALSFDPLARLGDALTILMEDVPGLIPLVKNPGYGSTPKTQIAAALERLHAAAQEVEALGLRNAPARRGGKSWHDDAMWLAFLLRAAAARERSERSLVLSSATGNGVVFIKAALGLVQKDADMITSDAITKAIARYAVAPIPHVVIRS